MTKQVAPGIEFNGNWYTVTADNGETWEFDADEENDVAYARGGLDAWTKWLAFVESKAQNG